MTGILLSLDSADSRAARVMTGSPSSHSEPNPLEQSLQLSSFTFASQSPILLSTAVYSRDLAFERIALVRGKHFLSTKYSTIHA